jgi:hypothetical protein
MNISRNRSLGTIVLAVMAVLLPAAASAAAQEAQPTSAAQTSQPSAPPCAGLPPGRHMLLEKMAAGLGLTCEQQLKIEPLLHSEEAVSKPLLRFQAFSRDERQTVMLKIKLAARRQIRPLLTTDQQKKMDEDIDSLARGGRKPPNSKSKSGAKKAAVEVDLFESQESLSRAILSYSALSLEERKALVLQVKQAARRNSGSQLTPDQQKKIDDEIRQFTEK